MAPVRRGSSRQTARLVGKFDRSLRRTADVLVDKFGEDNAPVVHQEMLAEYRRLIPEIPYIGGWRNPNPRCSWEPPRACRCIE